MPRRGPAVPNLAPWDRAQTESAIEEAREGSELLPNSAVTKSRWERFGPYAAEVIGTFLLTLTFLCNVDRLRQSAHSAAPAHHEAVHAAPMVVTSNAFMFLVITYALFHVSGANLNPSITIALFLSGRQELVVAGMFCLCQVFGGAAAAMIRLNFLMHGKVSKQDGTKSLDDVFGFGPKPHFNGPQALFVELIYTSLICFVFLNCAAARRSNQTGRKTVANGFAVGFAVLAGGTASAHVSGTVMNPAIAIGVQFQDIFTKPNGWGLAYLLPELLGAVLSVSAYRVVRPSEFMNHGHTTPRRRTSCVNHESAALLFGEDLENPVGAKIMAEFIGTFFLVFTKALVSVAEPTPVEAWSVGAVVVSLVYALRGVSGGLFNPAASLSSMIVSGKDGRMPVLLGIIYMVVQVLASVIAVLAYAMVNNGKPVEIQASHKFSSKPIVLGTAETIFTCFCCYIVLVMTPPLTGIPRSVNANVSGITQGFSLAASNLAIGQVTGSVLNPAIAIGFAGLNMINKLIRGDTLEAAEQQCWYYVFFEILGAIIAAGLFQATHAHLYHRTGSQHPKAPAPAEAALAFPKYKSCEANEDLNATSC